MRVNILSTEGNNHTNQQNFKGLNSVVRNEKYRITSINSKILQNRDGDFLSNLGFILRRKESELKDIYEIQDPLILNREFRKIKMSSLSDKAFSSKLKVFLKQRGFINEEGMFNKVPSKLLVLKDCDSVASNFTYFADRIVIDGYKHAEGKPYAAQIKGKSFYLKNIEEPFLDVLAKTVIIKDSYISKIVASKYVKGDNLTYCSNIYSRGRVNLNDSIVHDVKARKQINFENVLAGGNVETKDFISVMGYANQVGGDLKGNNMSLRSVNIFGDIKSQEGCLYISGYFNWVDGNVYARRINAKETTFEKSLYANNIDLFDSTVKGNLSVGSNLRGQNLKVQGNINADMQVCLENSEVFGNVKTNGGINLKCASILGNVKTLNDDVSLENSIVGSVDAKRVFALDSQSSVLGKINAKTSFGFQIKNIIERLKNSLK